MGDSQVRVFNVGGIHNYQYYLFFGGGEGGWFGVQGSGILGPKPVF